ncbi:MAG: 50S ribosomal protein L30e, partial [Candidatus Micrarchaeota archaeon]
KTILGSDRTRKLAMHGEAKAIVVARNCPANVKQDIMHYSSLSGVPLIEFTGTSVELGVVCGKPFPVSALSVIEAGNSDILKSVAAPTVNTE